MVVIEIKIPREESIDFKEEFVNWIHERHKYKHEKNLALTKPEYIRDDHNYTVFVKHENSNQHEGSFGKIYEGNMVILLSEFDEEFILKIGSILLPENYSDMFSIKVAVKKTNDKYHNTIARNEIENEFKMLCEIGSTLEKVSQRESNLHYVQHIQSACEIHPNILQNGICQFLISQIQKDIGRYIIYPFLLGGTLSSRLQLDNDGTTPDLRIRYWLLPMMETLINLHSLCELAHGDLKPNNVCFKENTTYSQPILIDFSRCCPLNTNVSSYNTQRHDISYYAPYNYSGISTAKMDDIYGINVMTIEILLGKLLPRTKDFNETFRKSLAMLNDSVFSIDNEKTKINNFMCLIMKTVKSALNQEINLIETYTRHKAAVVQFNTARSTK